MQISKKIFSRQWLRKGLTLTISISILTILILFFFSTTSDTWRSLLTFRLETVFLLIGTLCLSWFLEGLRVKLITAILEENIPLKDILRINLAALFSGNITPFTSGSLPTQVYLLHQKGLSVGKASAVVTIRITFSNLFFAIGGPAILFFFRYQILNELGLSHLSGVIHYILFLALIFSAFLIFFLWRPAKGEILVKKFFRLKPVERLLGFRTEVYCQRVIAELEEFHSCLTVLFRKKFLPVLGVICLTFLYWVVFFSIAPVVMTGFGVYIGDKIARLIMLQFIILFLLSFIPIPGGSGLAELGLYSIFSIYLPKHLLAISVVIWRFLSYHLNTLIGGFFFLKLLMGKAEKEADLPG